MVVSHGSCPDCHRPIVYLKKVNDEVIVVVRCFRCRAQVDFDLERLYAALVGERNFDDMLENFVPKGLPN